MLVQPGVVIQFAGLLEPNSLTCIETADFILHAYETPTGVRFFATASLGEVKVGEFLRAASSVYSDLILKVRRVPPDDTESIFRRGHAYSFPRV